MKLEETALKRLWIAPAAVIIDQLTKHLMLRARGNISLGGVASLISPVYNTGAAFSLGSGGGWALIVLTAILILGLSVYLLRKMGMPMLTQIGLWLIVGGGAGNLIDRLRFGGVVDFIRTDFISFPIFNFADVCVCCGAILTALGVIIGGKRVSRDGSQ